jgi:plasmid stability protein
MSQKDWTSLMLRLPPEVKAGLEVRAKQNCRSQNAEIVFRLAKSLEAERCGQAA